MSMVLFVNLWLAAFSADRYWSLKNWLSKQILAGGSQNVAELKVQILGSMADTDCSSLAYLRKGGEMWEDSTNLGEEKTHRNSKLLEDERHTLGLGLILMKSSTILGCRQSAIKKSAHSTSKQRFHFAQSIERIRKKDVHNPSPRKKAKQIKNQAALGGH
jgi:hypothetical protein